MTNKEKLLSRQSYRRASSLNCLYVWSPFHGQRLIFSRSMSATSLFPATSARSNTVRSSRSLVPLPHFLIYVL